MQRNDKDRHITTPLITREDNKEEENPGRKQQATFKREIEPLDEYVTLEKLGNN